MQIEILGADSLGCRSLATLVTTSKTRILIDPGVSVCPKRDGLPPHRLELEALVEVRARIQARAREAQAIVITHFHHDHYSSFEHRELDMTNPEVAREIYGDTPVYVKAWQRHLNQAQKMRAIAFVRDLGRRVTPADGVSAGDLTFSPPFKHGEQGSQQGWVTMVSIDDAGDRAVFASDIQLIEEESVDWIIARQPQVVIASGPPIYLGVLSEQSMAKAAANLMRLAEAVPTTIVDHHLLRTAAYRDFLADSLACAQTRGHRVLTAAEFMGLPNTLLEARRAELWKNP
ncbi:MAG: MBL fold metallo-hydrolase [Candidatus Eisenbacteria bacterium]